MKKLHQLISRITEKLQAIDQLKNIYSGAPVKSGIVEFFQYFLRSLQITLIVSQRDLANVPKQGSLVIVSNHPHGLLDGISAGAIVPTIRPDVKFLATARLEHIPEFGDRVIWVDVSQGKYAVNKNTGALLEAYRHLKTGGALMVFPGRQVSHFRFREMEITDPPWSSNIAKLVQLTEAPVLPVYFTGHNSLIFQLAGLIHPHLLTMLLAKELIKKRSSVVEMRIGEVLPWQLLKKTRNDGALTRRVRLACYAMANRAPVSEVIESEAGAEGTAGVA
ncbi:MAG TPA: lysophospholipid acyltransferase family protein [Pyrinomonadaceae bacterium]|jgi:putative hemolysin|nr:lysophospholipid acyltransferase family protein [Pyrinomonadaceae bacterium]